MPPYRLVIARSATRDVAISRKGNVGNEHAPASSPAVAHRRAKRTGWRMRGIEPYNKIIVVFPSSVLPSLRFGNPPFPEGEGLIGCVHSCHFGALVEKSPATGTAQYVPAPAHLPAVAHRREIPRNRNEDDRTRASQMPAGAPCRASPLARGGSPHPAEEIALRLTQTTEYNNSIFGGII